jgi:hypothetical protein
MGLWFCSRFKRLVNERNDRPLKDREIAFLARHRARCAPCRLAETQGAHALSMLRLSAMDVEVMPSFEERVMRRYKVQRVHESLRFWSPALIGAAVASVLVLAGLQIVLNSSRMPTLQPPTGEARRLIDHSPTFPEILRTTIGPSVR